MWYRLLFCCCLAIPPCLSAQSRTDTALYALFREVVFTLADDRMRGRATGSPEAEVALQYIDNQMEKLTGQPLRKQPFFIRLDDTTRLRAVNGYCFLNRHRPATVLIGAHYDHLGMGGSRSLSFTSSGIHNGADDNASGVALLLGLAEYLAGREDLPVNFLLVLYSGHEIGLFGSAAFERMLAHRRRFGRIAAVVNLDMVGRLNPEGRWLKCVRSPVLDSLLIQAHPEACGLTLRTAEDRSLTLLDTKPFYAKGIPCLNVSTGIHGDYHKTTDDAVYLNLAGMVDICHYLREVLATFQP